MGTTGQIRSVRTDSRPRCYVIFDQGLARLSGNHPLFWSFRPRLNQIIGLSDNESPIQLAPDQRIVNYVTWGRCVFMFP